ncbi:hypothetical protein N9045_01520 [bacterium]|nr:hypothetical protein [bacterium]
MINNCIYCNSAENLNTQLSLKLEDGTIAKVSVCDTHAEDATIKSAREKYIEKTNQLRLFLEQAKELGIDIGSLQEIGGQNTAGTSSPPAPIVQPPPAASSANEQVENKSSKESGPAIISTNASKSKEDSEDWITTDKYKDVKINPKVSGSAPGVTSHSSYEVSGNQDKLSEDLTSGKVKMAVAEGRGGQPIPIPQTRVDGTGTTNIRIVNKEDDTSLQNRFRQMAQSEHSPDFRQGYQDSQRTCPICKGDGTISNNECPKCKGLGVISVY